MNHSFVIRHLPLSFGFRHFFPIALAKNRFLDYSPAMPILGSHRRKGGSGTGRLRGAAVCLGWRRFLPPGARGLPCRRRGWRPTPTSRLCRSPTMACPAERLPCSWQLFAPLGSRPARNPGRQTGGGRRVASPALAQTGQRRPGAAAVRTDQRRPLVARPGRAALGRVPRQPGHGAQHPQLLTIARSTTTRCGFTTRRSTSAS